ncbi:MAG: D-alanyl-D-alanine carboxypeptidase family protein [Pseudomonadota bacterium]
MKTWRMRPARHGLFLLGILWLFVALPLSALAAPYAAMVMDARTGEVLHARNADTRLHPASLTKMMTLYIAFEAVERGEISMDTRVLISKKAAAEVPSKLGLRAGSRIQLRYLVRAAAIKSANDAATAIGEAISGSEAAFARRMTRTAKALGMTRTTFKNAHGLTEAGHLSTARDMTILGRRVLYDYPQYYNLFSRRSTSAGIATVHNTNRRLLNAYRGADGIKTGYTRAAGFNLVSSAQRGDERIIATVFGGKSTASRNAKVAELLDLGFRRAPSRAPVRKPSKPVYAEAATNGSSQGAGKTIRVSGLVKTSYRPKLRPGSEPVLVAAADPVTETPLPPAEPEPPTATVGTEDIQTALLAAQVAQAQSQPKPPPVTRPEARPQALILARAEPLPTPAPEVVTRLSTSGGRHWGVNVGRYTSRFKAEKVLLQTALKEMATLDGSLRKVVRRPQGFDATFMGLTRDGADRACRRLQARGTTCFMIGPS